MLPRGIEGGVAVGGQRATQGLAPGGQRSPALLLGRQFGARQLHGLFGILHGSVGGRRVHRDLDGLQLRQLGGLPRRVLRLPGHGFVLLREPVEPVLGGVHEPLPTGHGLLRAGHGLPVLGERMLGRTDPLLLGADLSAHRLRGIPGRFEGLLRDGEDVLVRDHFRAHAVRLALQVLRVNPETELELLALQ